MYSLARKATFSCKHSPALGLRDTGGNHLIVQLKGNQPKLLRQVKALAREAPVQSRHRQFDHKRQRIEWREVRVFTAAALPAEWDGLISTVIEVQRTRDVLHPQSGEWRKTEKVA